MYLQCFLSFKDSSSPLNIWNFCFSKVKNSGGSIFPENVDVICPSSEFLWNCLITTLQCHPHTIATNMSIKSSKFVQIARVLLDVRDVLHHIRGTFRDWHHQLKSFLYAFRVQLGTWCIFDKFLNSKSEIILTVFSSFQNFKLSFQKPAKHFVFNKVDVSDFYIMDCEIVCHFSLNLNFS